MLRLFFNLISLLLAFVGAFELFADGAQVQFTAGSGTQSGAFDFLVNFVTMNGNAAWGIYSDLHLVTPDIHYHNGDVISDHDFFISFSTEY